MSQTADRPLSHWIAVARMGFERDFHRIFTDLGINRADVARRIQRSPAYVSKVLNGESGNFTLETMAKWARSVGAILQVRLVKEGEEVVRVLNYETAGRLDDASVSRVADSSPAEGKLLTFSVRTNHSGTLTEPTFSGETYLKQDNDEVIASGSTDG